jgi:hypothetical protein
MLDLNGVKLRLDIPIPRIFFFAFSFFPTANVICTSKERNSITFQGRMQGNHQTAFQCMKMQKAKGIPGSRGVCNSEGDILRDWKEAGSKHGMNMRGDTLPEEATVRHSNNGCK